MRCRDRAHDGFRTLAKRIELEHADRAVPDHRAGLRDQHGVLLRGARADIENHVGRCDIFHFLHRRRRIRLELWRHHNIHRNRHLGAARFCVNNDLLGDTDQIAFHQRLADGQARRSDKRVGDAATDDQLIDFANKILQQSELAGNFRSRHDRQQRPLRMLQRLA